jgi:succinoglycan biosynthesis protein ExoO
MGPKVSVIIPAYNSEAYIFKAIESVLSQTYVNLEVIVVDDVSSDNTLQIINEISDPRLRVFCNEKNLGAGLTRNFAMEQATGEWVSLLDSDDWFAHDRLENLIQIADAESADMVSDNLSFIRDGETSPYATLLDMSSEKVTSSTTVDLKLFLRADTCGHFPLFSYTKPLLKMNFLRKYGLKYDTEIARMGEDFRFYLRCLANGAHFIYTPSSYYFQRMRDGSLTTQSKVNIFSDFYRGNQNLLREPFIQENPIIVEFLSRDSKHLEKRISYYSVVEPLKKKRLLETAFALAKNPCFVIQFLYAIPQILSRRIELFF